MRKILILGLICLFMLGCLRLPFMTSVWLKKDRPAYVRTHPGLSSEMRKAILKGEVLIGMTFEQVSFSRGEPLDKNEFKNETGTASQWVYVGIKLNAREQTSRKEERLDHKYAYVYFKDGKVTHWESRLSKR